MFHDNIEIEKWFVLYQILTIIVLLLITLVYRLVVGLAVAICLRWSRAHREAAALGRSQDSPGNLSECVSDDPVMSH